MANGGKIRIDVHPAGAVLKTGSSRSVPGGNSTTMRMIGGVSPRTAGELSVFGMDPDRRGPHVRARLGVVSQENYLDPELTVRQPTLRARTSCWHSCSCPTGPTRRSSRSPAA
jgi:ABC-type proline/glycine betaine transport system ATPase subunit